MKRGKHNLVRKAAAILASSVLALTTAVLPVSAGTVTYEKGSSVSDLKQIMDSTCFIAINSFTASGHQHGNVITKKVLSSCSGNDFCIRDQYGIATTNYVREFELLTNPIKFGYSKDTLVVGTGYEITDNGSERFVNGNKVESAGTVYADTDEKKYIDLDNLQASFGTYSKQLSEMSDNGITLNESKNRFDVNISDGVAVMNLTADVINSLNADTVINFPANSDSVALFNIDMNGAGGWSKKPFVLLENESTVSSGEEVVRLKVNRIYYNFYDSSSSLKRYTGSVSFNDKGWGTILAPYADVTLGSNFCGVIVGENINAVGETHFTGPVKFIEPGKQSTPTDPSKPDTPTDPSKPDTPTDPSKPDTPTDPSKPDTPTDPSKPDTPTDPSKPDTPTDPSKPDTPTDPSKPDTPTDPSKPDTPIDPSKPDTPTDPSKPDTPTDPSKPDTPTDPSKPDTPTDPSKPDTPTDPSKPDTPTDPSKPDTPTDPSKPDTPTDPSKPDTPTDPDKPTIPQNPGSTDTNPKPGTPETNPNPGKPEIKPSPDNSGTTPNPGAPDTNPYPNYPIIIPGPDSTDVTPKPDNSEVSPDPNSSKPTYEPDDSKPSTEPDDSKPTTEPDDSEPASEPDTPDDTYEDITPSAGAVVENEEIGGTANNVHFAYIIIAVSAVVICCAAFRRIRKK